MCKQNTMVTQMQLHYKRKVISANYFDNFDKFIHQWKKLLAHQIVRQLLMACRVKSYWLDGNSSTKSVLDRYVLSTTSIPLI